MSRSDQYSVKVTINNVDYGIWDKLTGGETDSDELKYNPGAMAAQVSLGGKQTNGNITISRLFDQTRDLPKVPTLRHLCGKGACTVIKQSLDLDGFPTGAAEVYTGKLKSVTPPEHDSESSDAAMIEIEISVSKIS